MIEALKNRIFSLISKVVVYSVKDSEEFQKVLIEGFKSEDKTLEHIQPYGFAYNAPKGSEGVALFPNGSRDNGFILVLGNRTLRIKNLKNGEVALYDKFNNLIHLKDSGEIEVKATNKVVVKATNIELGDGGLEKVLNGEAFQNWANNHTHIGNMGVPTSKPMSQSSNLSATVKAKT